MLRSLQSLVVSFPAAPMVAAREMRQLLDTDREAFREAALVLLKGKDPEPSHQYLLTLLVTNDLIVDRLANPGCFEPADAIEIARRIQGSLDSFIDVKLMRMLIPSNGGLATVVDEGALLRVLEIVGAISDGSRVMPLLTCLLRHPAVKVRSKVALLLGRLNRNLRWVEAQLSQADARVRANSVESLWGVDSPEARQLFGTALADPDNRVVGNGAIGLYRCGDLGAADLLMKMLGDAEPKQRATAAWAMGESRDPRFLNLLAGRMADPDARVRSNVARSMDLLQRRIEEIQAIERLQVVITRSEIIGACRHLNLAVLKAGDRAASGIRPVNVVLTDDTRLMNRINLSSRRDAETTAGFALPRDVPEGGPFYQGLEASLKVFLRYKRERDGWTSVRFRYPVKVEVAEFRLDRAMLSSGSGGGRAAAPTQDSGHRESVAIRFTTDTRMLVQSFGASGMRGPAFESPERAVSQMIDAMSVTRGHRFIFLFLDQPAGGDWSALRRRAQQAKVAVHAISVRHAISSELEALCHESGGAAVTVGTPEEMGTACERLAASLVSIYSIDYSLPPDFSGAVKVQIFSEHGFGEDLVESGCGASMALAQH